MKKSNSQTMTRHGLMLILAAIVFVAMFMINGSMVHAETTPAKITLNKSVYVIKKGKTYTLKAKITDSAYAKKKIVWSTSKKSVATVTSKGKVKAKKKGTATITAKIKGTSFKATCKIRVGTPSTSVSMSKTKNTLYVGKSYTVKATVKPSNATIKAVKFSSSNTAVATVTAAGKITAVAPGTATITAKTTDGRDKVGKIVITVKKLPESIPADASENVIKVISCIQKYDKFIKDHSELCYKNGSNPAKTYSEAKTFANNNNRIPLNCIAPTVWALKEAELLPNKGNLYGTSTGFKGSFEQLKSYGTFIKPSSKMNLQEAADSGILKYGDIVAFGGGANHAVTYCGTNEDGHALCYEAGGDAQNISDDTHSKYAEGCGPIDYFSKYRTYYVSEIYRLK